MQDRKLVCVTGLPRAGSTLLCQILAQHPDIHSPGNSSPLPQILAQLRQNISDNEFFLAQLDHEPEAVHDRLVAAFRGFMDGWIGETEESVVVDKNRGWLDHLEMAGLLNPDCRMLVCVRDPGQILGSIEARHRDTMLIDFADHMAHASPYDRANRLFARDGIVGLPLRSFQNAQDLPAETQQRIFCVVFERLMDDPKGTTREICDFLGVERFDMDPDNLPDLRPESDSHYRQKFSHATRRKLQPPRRHPVPARIEAELKNSFAWFYNIFYRDGS